MAQTYGYEQPPDTPDIAKLRGAKFEVDPGLKSEYANLRAGVDKGFAAPTGAYYNPQVKDAIRRSSQERLGQQEAQAFREGQFDANKLGYSRDVAVAGMTAPTLVQRGSSSTGSGTVTQSESPLKTAVSVAGAAAPLSMTLSIAVITALLLSAIFLT